MKYIKELLEKDSEYIKEAKLYSQNYSFKNNRILLTSHYDGSEKKFPNVWTDLRYVLWKGQGKRCCLCEKKLNDIGAIDVEHYRPKTKYWWLAYEPKNYYLACAECNRQYKRSEFPLFNEDKRVVYETNSS